MSSYENPYSTPEKFGLTFVDEIEKEPDYDFDKVVVWKDEAGRYFWDADSGCSCPAPFEDVNSVDDLSRLTLQSEDFDPFESAVYAISNYGGHSCKERVDFIQGIRRTLRGQ